jgi:hypothetical protein
MRARWYDPAVGRFVSEDPGRDGGNWYCYTDDGPVSRADENGKCWALILGILAAGLVGAGMAGWLKHNWSFDTLFVGFLEGVGVGCAAMGGPLIGAIGGGIIGGTVGAFRGGWAGAGLGLFFGAAGGGIGGCGEALSKGEEWFEFFFAAVMGAVAADGEGYAERFGK